jgi:SAM-dependent methyltransferase
VYARISASKSLSEIFGKKEVTVGCVGGGPGSDFLGVLKFCEQAKKAPNLTCHLLDRDSAWGESWSDVGKKVGGSLQLTTHFNPFDVTDPGKWRVFKKHFQADLFTLIYFMSEVYALRKDADGYFNALFANMKPGAVLLFVDNNSPEFHGWFDELAKAHKLQFLEVGGGVMQLPTHEEKGDLEPYKTRLKRDPKLRADVAWRVVKK